MPIWLQKSEMLTASGTSGLNSMIWRRIDAVNVFGTSHYREVRGQPPGRENRVLPVHDVTRLHTKCLDSRYHQALLAKVVGKSSERPR